MDASGLDEEALLAEVAAGGEAPKAEVLLPEVIATMVADGWACRCGCSTTDAKLVGRHPRRRPAGRQRRTGPAGRLGHETQLPVGFFGMTATTAGPPGPRQPIGPRPT